MGQQQQPEQGTRHIADKSPKPIARAMIDGKFRQSPAGCRAYMADLCVSQLNDLATRQTVAKAEVDVFTVTEEAFLIPA